MAYLISEEAQDLLQDVKNFCDKEVAEQCKEYDVSGEWPKAIYDKAVEQGYQALEVPEEFGGPGLSRVDVAALIEQMAIADAGFATTISASGLGMKPVLIAGSDEQKQHVCDLILDGGFGAFCLTEPGAGSDASAGKTTAVKDGDEYVLNGRKCFITNGGVASFYCVTAMTDKSKGVKGISMFLVDAGTPGLSTGHEENKMGIRLSNTTDVIFQDVHVPAENIIGKEGDGFKIVMKALEKSRPICVAPLIGTAQKALEIAAQYTRERCPYGKPIGKLQGIQFKIADMEIKLQTARAMMMYAAKVVDEGKPISCLGSISKTYVSEAVNEIVDEALQILGGYGYSKDYPIEKMLRDVRVYRIFEGTNEVQRQIIGKTIIGKC